MPIFYKENAIVLYKSIMFSTSKRVLLLLIVLNNVILILTGYHYISQNNQVELDINISPQNKISGKLIVPFDFPHKTMTSIHIFLPFIINQNQNFDYENRDFDVVPVLIDNEYTRFDITTLSDANRLNIQFEILNKPVETSNFSPSFYDKPDAFEIEHRNSVDYTLHLNFDAEQINHPFDNNTSRFNNVVIPSIIVITFDAGITTYQLPCQPPYPTYNCQEYNLPPPQYNENSEIFTTPINFYQGRRSGWINYQLPTSPSAPAISTSDIITLLINLINGICQIIIPLIFTLIGINWLSVRFLSKHQNTRDFETLLSTLLIASICFVILLSIICTPILILSGFASFFSENKDLIAPLIISLIICIISSILVFIIWKSSHSRSNQPQGPATPPTNQPQGPATPPTNQPQGPATPPTES